jgi:hypothetical protein
LRGGTVAGFDGVLEPANSLQQGMVAISEVSLDLLGEFGQLSGLAAHKNA